MTLGLGLLPSSSGTHKHIGHTFSYLGKLSRNWEQFTRPEQDTALFLTGTT